MPDGVIRDNMKKSIILAGVFSLIQILLIIATKGFSYPLLLLFLMIGVFSYISIEDWKTGFISVPLNIITFLLAGLFAFFYNMSLKTIGINFLCFVLPFIVIETVFQLFINKDDEKFLIGGGDIILFASMSLIFSSFNMACMLFFACLMSLITSKIIRKTLVHFAPFIQTGFLIAFLFGDFLQKIIFRF